jgi:sec-independent protein translocase protein TatC
MAEEQRTLTIIEHLTELRKRITIALAALVVGVIVAFIFQGYIFKVLMKPLHGTKVTSITTFGPAEPFMVALKVSIYAGLLLALPVIMWELWAYIMPALYENEKKTIVPYVAMTTGLFLFGVVFGYYLVLPIGLKWLLGYGGDIFNQQLRAEDYIGFVTLFLLAFGVVFEMPVFILILAALRIVSAKLLRKQRRIAIVVIAVVSMVATPSQDPVSMILMMIPLLILYELSIILTSLMEKRRNRRDKLPPA